MDWRVQGDRLRVARFPFDLRDLYWAVTATRHQSLRQAASALNVHLPTCSRALRDLEHHPIRWNHLIG
ncbi:LysR family transcriptional regulator [Nguyenibacter vanlangensis]|uniref:helix-turn-helix domain-containing protein n=1 Tax=Nguyenibacter vanlangensis TaxID=1216886 RepID=UPI0038D17DBF